MPSGAGLADGYDPISPDESRRSSDASHCGGLPGVGSLTPAQRYRLKAKYAAATGGPPPTPLPSMERVGMGGHNSLPGDYLGPAEPRFLANGLLRRHSSNDYPGYAGSVPPHPVPRNGVRRASDPARTAANPHAVPKVHRFQSMGNVTCQEWAELLCSPWVVLMPTFSAMSFPHAHPASVKMSSWRV